MRPNRGSVYVCASLTAVIVVFSAAPALAKLQLHVLGLRPGGRFGNNQVYNGLGCHGRNRSPALRFTGVPAGTRSLAVTMFDPDAPTQSGWWQWLTYDLPAGTRHLTEGAGATGGRGLPQGARQGRNDFSQVNYGGPCPPVGAPAHHYQLIVWADRVRMLPVTSWSSAALISLMIERYAIARSMVVVPYGR